MGNSASRAEVQHLLGVVHNPSVDVGTLRRAARGLAKCSSVANTREELVEAQGIEVLLSLVGHTDTECVRYALKALCYIAEDPTNPVPSPSSLQPLVKLVESEGTDLRRLATDALANWTLNVKNRLQFIHSIGLQPLHSLLKFKDPRAQCQAAHQLSILSANSTYQIRLSNDFGLQPLLSLAGSTSYETQCHALNALGNLIVDSDNKVKLVRMKGLQMMLDLAAESHDEKVRASATAAIANFFENYEDVSSMIQESVLNAALSLAKLDDREAHRIAAKVLAELSAVTGFQCFLCKEKPIQRIRWRCSVCKSLDLCNNCYQRQSDDAFAHSSHSPTHLMVSQNAAGYDVVIMGSLSHLNRLAGSSDALAQYSAARALANLSRNDANRFNMVAENALESLTNLTHSKSVMVQRPAVEALAHLLVPEENRAAVVSEPRYLQSVISMTRSPDLSIQRYSAQILSLLCYGDHMQQIVEEGGLQSLVCFSYSEDLEIQAFAAEAFSKITATNYRVVSYVVKQGGMQPVLYLSGSAEWQIQLFAVTTLANIAQFADTHSRFAEEGAMASIRALSQSDYVDVARIAFQLLQNLHGTLGSSAGSDTSSLHRVSASSRSSRTELTGFGSPTVPASVMGLNGLGSGGGGSRIRLKCQYRSENRVMMVSSDCTIQQLTDKLEGEYGRSMVVRYDDDEGDRITIKTDSDLQEAFALFLSSKSHSLRLYLAEARPSGSPGSALATLGSEAASPRGAGPAPRRSDSGTGYLAGAGSGASAGAAGAGGAPDEAIDGNGNSNSLLEPGWTEIPPEELEIGDKIGMGGNCTVRRGRWRQTDVAIKTFNEDLIDAELLETIRDEIAMLTKVRHPNVVLFLGACTTPPQISIVTEFIPRGSLYQVLHSNTELSWARRLSMAIDAACGMNYLHHSDPIIIHRDLKSANLLVDENWTVKVCDLGLSRVKLRTYCSSGFCHGTFGWMSPECIRNERYDERADVYSFGVVLWELVTRRIPYSNMTPIQIVAAVAFQKQRLEFRPGEICPAQLKPLINQCWLQEPADRPSFDEILERLEELQLQGEDEAEM